MSLTDDNYFGSLAKEFEGEENLSPQEPPILRKNAQDLGDEIEFGGIDTLEPTCLYSLKLPSIEEGIDVIY